MTKTIGSDNILNGFDSSVSIPEIIRSRLETSRVKIASYSSLDTILSFPVEARRSTASPVNSVGGYVSGRKMTVRPSITMETVHLGMMDRR